MTQRWRKRLRDLDATGPNDSLLDRAKGGPTYRDEAPVGPKLTTRVGTVIVAFLVFALAISAFAIPALRMGGEQTLAAGAGLFPIWPTQSTEQLRQLQADADAGNADWALNPASVATRFGQQVMGWPDAAAVRSFEPYCFNTPSNAPGATPVACNDLPVGGSSVGAAVPDFPTPTGEPSTGVFRSYAIFPSAGEKILVPPEWVQLYQPLGQTQDAIWAVLQAQGAAMLSVGPGQVVHDGSTLSASVWMSGGSIPTLGYGSCGQSAATSVFHQPPGGDIAGHQPPGGDIAGMELAASFNSSDACSGQQPGYVWAATSEKSLAAPDGVPAGDPMTQQAMTPLQSLTALPIVAVFAEGGASLPTATPTQSASDLPLTWTTYTDRLGWTVDVPPGWTTNQLVGSGAQFSSDGIVIDIGGGGTPGQSDDSSYPLDPNGFLFQGEGGLIGNFAGDGRAFGFVVMEDGTTLTKLNAVQKPLVDRMISSIRFQPWQLGETRNGLTAVGKVLPAATAEWLIYKLTGDHYVAYYGGDGGRALLGPAPACPGGPATYEIRETGEAGITCSDGTAANWNFGTGAPKAGNPSPFVAPLPTHPAVLSWDGWLLAKLPQSASP